MRISDRYIGRHILTGTLFAILLLSLLLVLGQVFKQIRPLLVEFGAPIWVLGEFIMSVLPVSLIFTIPWAFLSAVLLVFGRLSTDNELNAFRAAGMSLTRLSAPVIAIGAVLSLVCLWLNLQVAPRASKGVEEIVRSSLIKDPRVLLRAGVDQTRFDNVRIYSESDDGVVFKNFHIFQTGSKGESLGGSYIHANSATTVNDEEKQEIRLRFDHAYAEGAYLDDKDGTPKTKDFTLLSEELQWMVIDYSQDGRSAKVKPRSLTNPELDAFVAEHPELPGEYRARYLSEKTRRYTSSFACLAFAFIGVPLGIKARRRDTSSGLILSLAIGAVYFIASSMIEPGENSGYLLWIPNVICMGLGVLLFRRARFR